MQSNIGNLEQNCDINLSQIDQFRSSDSLQGQFQMYQTNNDSNPRINEDKVIYEPEYFLNFSYNYPKNDKLNQKEYWSQEKRDKELIEEYNKNLNEISEEIHLINQNNNPITGQQWIDQTNIENINLHNNHLNSNPYNNQIKLQIDKKQTHFQFQADQKTLQSEEHIEKNDIFQKKQSLSLLSSSNSIDQFNGDTVFQVNEKQTSTKLSNANKIFLKVSSINDLQENTKQNTLKNIFNAFKQQTKQLKECKNMPMSGYQFNNIKKQMMKYFKRNSLNNSFVNYIISHKYFKILFYNFLENQSEVWLKPSKVKNKDETQQCIQFLQQLLRQPRILNNLEGKK